MDNFKDKIADEAAGLVKQVYNDALQPSVKEVGVVTARLIKELLIPIRAMVWGVEKVEKFVLDELEKRSKNISKEQLHTPAPDIAVPIFQELSYTTDSKLLRDMYMDLLASSMNANKDKYVHKAFVKIISQLNELEAKLLQYLTINNDLFNIYRFASASYPNGTDASGNLSFKMIYGERPVPKYLFAYAFQDYNLWDMSAALMHLETLGLINCIHNKKLIGSLIKKKGDMISHSYELNDGWSADGRPEYGWGSYITYNIKSRIGIIYSYLNDGEIHVLFDSVIPLISDFGMRFVKCCVPDLPKDSTGNTKMEFLVSFNDDHEVSAKSTNEDDNEYEYVDEKDLEGTDWSVDEDDSEDDNSDEDYDTN